MLADIRKYAGSFVVKILFLLLLLSFVIWGIADVFRPQGATGWIAKVGDQEISRTEFDAELRTTVRRLQQSFGGSLDQATIRSLGIARSVLGEMINRALIESEASSLGVRAGDELLRRSLMEEPRFRNSSGQFDNAAFQAFLQRLGRTQEAFFADLRQELSARAVVGSVEAGVVIPKGIIETIERYFGETREIEYVAIAIPTLSIDKAADEAALQAWYDGHGQDFLKPEYRKASVIIIDAHTLVDTINIDETELKTAYDERINEFSRPERRKFRQMLFTGEVEARWALDQLRSGRRWDDVAKTKEAGSPAVSVLGPLARMALPGELRAAVFETAPDHVNDPVKSSLGWHLIEVVSVEPGETAPLSEVADRLSRQLKEEKANDLMVDLGNRLEEAVGRGKSLEAAAEELGLPVRTIDGIDSKGSDATGRMLPDLPPKLVQTIFASPKGIASSLVEADHNTVFLVRVDEIQPSALRPFDEVRQAVEAVWLTDQRRQKARGIAQEIADRAGKDSLAQAATSVGLKSVTAGPFSRLGTPPAGELPATVIRQTLEAPAGRPLVIPTDDAIYVAVSHPKTAEKSAASENVLEEERAKGLDILRDDVLAQYLEALRARHAVRINQAALDDVQKQAP